jgi:hypothetical protein
MVGHPLLYLIKNKPFLFSVLKFIYIGEGPNEKDENFQDFSKLAKQLEVKRVNDDESLAGIVICLNLLRGFSNLGKGMVHYLCST